MKKKLLLLGGSSYLLPVIEKAHALGLYVITCDYLPHNAAHLVGGHTIRRDMV
jgi:hypothetical protein